MVRGLLSDSSGSITCDFGAGVEIMKQAIRAAIVAGALFGTVSVHAAPITTATQTISFGPGLTDFENASQNLNLFDSRLGTLDSVVITGTYGFNSSITVVNSAAGASSGTVRAESGSAFGSSVSGINTVIERLLDTA